MVGLVTAVEVEAAVVGDPTQDMDPWQDDDHEEEIDEKVVVDCDRLLGMASSVVVPAWGSKHVVVVESGLGLALVDRMDWEAGVVDWSQRVSPIHLQVALQEVLEVEVEEQNFPTEVLEVQQLQWLDTPGGGHLEAVERWSEQACHCFVHYATTEDEP